MSNWLDPADDLKNPHIDWSNMSDVTSSWFAHLILLVGADASSDVGVSYDDLASGSFRSTFSSRHDLFSWSSGSDGGL